MPEFRKDPVTGGWVIIATDRAKRPMDHVQCRPTQSGGFCPFCPGNEDKTPTEVYAIRSNNTKSDLTGWSLRVVPNKFPALLDEGELRRSQNKMYESISGVGDHEVIIDVPEHNHSMADYSSEQVERLFQTYRQRSLELGQKRRIRYIMIFKNSGVDAGASLDHPHSQIISLPVIPRRIKEEMSGAEDYFILKKRCLFCDMIEHEQANGERIVCENESAIAFTPYASRFPYEVWALPKNHQNRFEKTPDDCLNQMSSIVHEALQRIKLAADDPAYNIVLHTSPCTMQDGGSNHYHWHFEIVPKMTTIAGFEWGTGFYINPTAPEQAASSMRDVTLG